MQSTASVLLVEPKRSLRALSEREFKFREVDWQPKPPSPAEYIRTSVAILETHLVVAALNEAILEANVRTVGEVPEQIERIVEIAGAIARLDVHQVLRDNVLLPPAGSGPPLAPDAPAGADMESLVRLVRSLVAFCPIESIEQVAARSGEPELGHRCRLAYDALEAFVRRNAQPQDHVARTLGRAYVEGRLSLAEVAAVLGYDHADAIAFLEQNGYCRSVEVISLGVDERRVLLDKIHRTHLDATAQPVKRLVEREVIASQRIEGIDARPWVPRS